MAKINLLPWREELRNQRNQEFGIVAGIVAGAAILIVFLISSYYGYLIDNQKTRNKYMDSEIAKLENKIKEIKDLKSKKTRLLQRINTIQKLQTNRTEIVHLFDETVKSLPDGIYLTSLKQSGTNLSVTGVAESNSRVSEYVRTIEASEWMQTPRIKVITRNVKSALQTNNFTMTLQQSRPVVKKDSEKEGES